jgi:hypothetical protein
MPGKCATTGPQLKRRRAGACRGVNNAVCNRGAERRNGYRALRVCVSFGAWAPYYPLRCHWRKRLDIQKPLPLSSKINTGLTEASGLSL